MRRLASSRSSSLALVVSTTNDSLKGFPATRPTGSKAVTFGLVDRNLRLAGKLWSAL